MALCDRAIRFRDSRARLASDVCLAVLRLHSSIARRRDSGDGPGRLHNFAAAIRGYGLATVPCPWWPTGLGLFAACAAVGKRGAYFRYALVVLALCYGLVLLHVRGRPGRAWALIRRSEVCAIACGVDIVWYKVWAFTLAGFLAGIAGGLLAGGVGQLDGNAFPASQSIMVFALSIVGGAYSWAGPLFAGLLLRAFPALLNDYHVDGNIATMVFGAGLLHALITAPQGIAGQVGDADGAVRKLVGRLDQGSESGMIEIDDVTVMFGGVRGLNALTASLPEPVTGLVGPKAPARRRSSTCSPALCARPPAR